MKQQVFAILLVALIGAAAVVWFLANFERVPSERFVGYSGEARDHRYLAVERLITRMGIPARHIETLPELRQLPGDATLILPSRGAGLSSRERLALVEWIETGGHLIVEAAPGNSDPLLELFDVETGEAGEIEKGVEVNLPQAASPLRIEAYLDRTLARAGDSLRVQGETATFLLHFRLGAGRVTVLDEFWFMSNDRVGNGDHAELVWQLVRFQPATSSVLVFDNPRKPSLWSWLVERAWTVLTAGVVLIALWLWRIVSRFGPIAPEAELNRRRLSDHLRASGRFLWSTGAGAAMAEVAREAAIHRIARAQPDFASLTSAERETRLAAVFGLDAADARILESTTKMSIPHDFVHAIRVFQQIHERLRADRRRND